MTMNKTRKIIVGLLLIAVGVFIIITLGGNPEAKGAEYVEKQTDALTHDVSVVNEYKSEYVGDISNVSGLFASLPLGNTEKTYELDSDSCELTVIYESSIGKIGADKLKRDIVYNTAAAMAAIDNLQGVTYEFEDGRFSFSREDMENVFGKPLSNLLKENGLREMVQQKLNRADFTDSFFE